MEECQKKELILYRAACAYYKKDFHRSSSEFEKLANITSCKNDHSSFSLTDSVIRSLLKADFVDHKNVLKMLEHSLSSSVCTYGGQLQYWSLYLQVYQKVKLFDKTHFRINVLLCAVVGLPEHWIALAEFGSEQSSFYWGCYCRALYLLQLQTMNCQGFMREISEKKLSEIQKKFSRSTCESFIVKECMKRMKENNFNNESTSLIDPKMKCLYKDDKEQERIINDFVERYSWLFENDSHLLDMLKFDER